MGRVTWPWGSGWLKGPAEEAKGDRTPINRVRLVITITRGVAEPTTASFSHINPLGWITHRIFVVNDYFLDNTTVKCSYDKI